MIKLYKIRIGEKVYEVELEAVTEKEGSITTSTILNNANEVKTENSQNINENNASDVSGEIVKAPMQGLIVDVKVTVGQNVKAGDEIIILEAMKMENPIVAPKDGVVNAIKVSKGDTVNNDDILVILS